MAIPRFFRNADEELVVYDGSPLSWRISVYALIVKNKELLVTKSATEKLFDIPGGGVEFGETLEDALAREALEEAGARIKIKQLVHIHPDFFYYTQKKKFFQTLQLFYSADLIDKLTTQTDKKIIWRNFVALDNLDQHPLPQATLKALKQL